jgi:hypothetical protein
MSAWHPAVVECQGNKRWRCYAESYAFFVGHLRWPSNVTRVNYASLCYVPEALDGGLSP